MRPRALFAFLLILATSAAKATPYQSAPTAVIDITATEASGAALQSPLQTTDLMLRIDGRVHPVLGVRLAVGRSVSRATPAAVLPPPYASNQTGQGRDFSIAVDVTRFESTELPKIREVVDTLLGVIGPRDRVSVTALAEDGFTTDYTTRPEIVRAVAAKLPAAAQPMQDAKRLESAAVASLALLERRCAILAVDPGDKTLVYVAPPFGASSNIRKAIQSVAEVTARQRVQVVIIDPRGGGPSPGLAALAAATGGVVLPSATSLAGVIGPTSARQALQFAFTDDEQDDKLHRVQIVSLRKDVQVTGPAQLFIPRSGTVADPLAALADMLRQPRVWRDLPLRLAAFPTFDNDRDRLRLLVLGEPDEPMLALAWARFALFEPSGAMVAEWTAEGADLATRPIMTAVLVPPGPYRLRMVASELAGRRGSVDYEFDVRLTPAAPLSLGPLMFGGISNQAFLPVLQAPGDAAAVMAYAEIYGRIAAEDKLTTKLEIASAADAPPLAVVDGSVRTTPTDDRRAAVGTLDLTPLAPGDYFVRAIVSLNGKEIGRVSRTLRKAVQ